MSITLNYLKKIKNKINKIKEDNCDNLSKFKLFNDAYLINLDSRIDRLNHSSNQLNKINIKFKRYPGLIFNDRGKYLSTGKRGCTESHYEIIRNNINNKYPFLIMEDDIVFADYFNEIHDYIKILPEKWDILYFYTNNQNEKHIRWINMSPYGTHFYVINNTSAEKISSLLKNNNKVIDNFYNDTKSIIKFATSKNLVAQDLMLGTNIEYTKRSFRMRTSHDNKFLL